MAGPTRSIIATVPPTGHLGVEDDSAAPPPDPSVMDGEFGAAWWDDGTIGFETDDDWPDDHYGAARLGIP